MAPRAYEDVAVKRRIIPGNCCAQKYRKVDLMCIVIDVQCLQEGRPVVGKKCKLPVMCDETLTRITSSFQTL